MNTLTFMSIHDIIRIVHIIMVMKTKVTRNPRTWQANKASRNIKPEISMKYNKDRLIYLKNC